ncbi:MAG: hypothetical protein KC457_16580, partial [Myxococcales bacterium]|nr:hypothetical protein [Myxococcales bacterium]
MTTYVTGDFHFHWKDDNDNKTGSFEGSQSSSNWQDLDNFALSQNAAHTLHFSVCPDVTYTTFVAVKEDADDGSSSPNNWVGIKIAPGVTDDGSAISHSLTLNTKHVELEASVLSGYDPKLQVRWGQGTTSLVQLVWNGQYWTVDGNRYQESDGDHVVYAGTALAVAVTDSSTQRQTAGLGIIVSDTVANICDVRDLASFPSGSYTFTASGSVGDTTRYS